MANNGHSKHLIVFQPSGRRGEVEDGTTVMRAAHDLGVEIETLCGEQAVCGKCKVRIEEGSFEKYGIESHRDDLSPMGESETKFFNRRQQQEGYRLACQTHIHGDVVVFVPEASRAGKQVVRKKARDIAIKLNPAVRKYYVELTKASLDDTLGDWERLQNHLNKQHGLTNLTIDYMVLLDLQTMVRQGSWRVTVSVWMNQEVIKVEPGYVEKGYGLAVDIGSTSVAGYLCDLSNGELVTTVSMMNPQVMYGEDVMSRITYTMTQETGLEQLNKTILEGLNELVGDAARIAGISRQDIVDMTVVGNTCMHHLFLNLDPKYIGRSPFPPSIHHSVNVKARDVGFKIAAEVKNAPDLIGISPPCQVACPAGVNAQDFLDLIIEGRYSESLAEIRKHMPFAGVLGRVCTQPCEKECERGKVDEPISIRSLHRFVADYELKNGRAKATPVKKAREEKVAVVGSGPAGLSCAYELVQKGYPVTVFEAAPKAGGILRYGIPDYRLPKNVLDNEISYIEELGVEIRTNSPVKDLQAVFNDGYKAIFLATGAWVSREMGIPNENVDGVVHALPLLKELNSGNGRKFGERVAIVGGGNSAIDAARVAKRLGGTKVSIVYRRSRDEMPAIESEVREAEEEGIEFQFLTAPVKITASNGRVEGMQCIRMELGEPDASGRKAPVPVAGSEFNMDVDNVIMAIGEKLDTTGFPENFEYNEQRFLKVDPVTLETGLEGVFAGGDILGPADVVSAVRAGQEAAVSVELYFAGVDPKAGRPPVLKRVPEVPKQGLSVQAREPTPRIDPQKRSAFEEVEEALEKDAAVKEAMRCLHCSVFAEAREEEVIEARNIGINISPGAYIHVLPIEAGFVGADNVGVLICEEPYNQDEIELIIDIGTNGELILGNRKKLISSSCATGPAFEGAEIKYGMRAAPGAIERIKIDRETQEVSFKVIDKDEWSTESKDEEMGARGLCGSAVIDIIPQMFAAGIIERNGRFKKGLEHRRFRVTDNVPEYVIAWASQTAIGEDITITIDDIRNLQLGKAAMYAGAKIMMKHLGVDRIDRVVVAGAFGSYIDKESAAAMALFPDCDLSKVNAVGNAAGDGARMALLNIDKRGEADEYAREVEYIELTVEPGFDRIFSEAIWIPHMKDQFPHLGHLLPKAEDKK